MSEKPTEFVPNYVETLVDFDLAEYQKKVQEVGFDPYDLNFDVDVTKDRKLWPKVDPWHMIDYFVLRTETFSGEQMMNFKSFEAHNFLTSKHVQEPRVKEVQGDRVLALCKVQHSQRISLAPLHCWILAQKDGKIICSQCNCMAGRNSCSHVAAVVFLFEFWERNTGNQSSTDVLCQWLPPSARECPMQEVREVDFTSAATRKKRLESTVAGLDVDDPAPSVPSSTLLARLPTSEEFQAHLQNLAEVSPLAAVLSHNSELCKPWVTEITTPLDLSKLYDPSKESLSHKELLAVCEDVVKKMVVTPAEIEYICKATRQQGDSVLWFTFRVGRITSTKISLVLQGSVSAPADTTVKAICHPSQRSLGHLDDIKRGNSGEPQARKWYVNSQSKLHPGLKVTLMGLVLHPEKPYLAASPDGKVTCSCCPGFGVLEIKCPREANFLQYFDDEGEMRKTGPTKHVYEQVQCHMLVTGASYCDFISFLDKSNGDQQKLLRVAPDRQLHETMLKKASEYYLHVCLPELVAHWHQRHQPGNPNGRVLQPMNQVETVCYCGFPRHGTMVECLGTNPGCLKVFHGRCVDVLTVSKKFKYYCDICKPQVVKIARKRRRTKPVVDENAQP